MSNSGNGGGGARRAGTAGSAAARARLRRGARPAAPPPPAGRRRRSGTTGTSAPSDPSADSGAPQPARPAPTPAVPDPGAQPGLRSRPGRPFPGGPSEPPRGDGSPPEGGLFDLLKVAVAILDTAGRVVLWSPAAEELLGWPNELLVGRRIDELIPDEKQVARIRAAIQDTLRHGRWAGFAELRDRDGAPVAVDARISLLVDGDGTPFLQVSLAETAAVRAVERDLAVRDALFEQSPLGIAILDTDLRYTAVNRTLAEMNGVALEDHVGRTTGETLPERAADEITAIQRQVLATGEPVIDVTLASPVTARSGYRSISYSRMTDRSGRVLGISGTVMDVTERYRAVSKVEHARRRLSLLNEFGSRVGDLLDASRIAQELASSVVPRLTDHSAVILLQAVAHGDDLPRHGHDRRTSLLQLGTASVQDGPEVEVMLRRGARITFAEDSACGRVLRTGVPELLSGADQLGDVTYPGDPKLQAAHDLGVHSMLVVPLRARGIVIGLLLVSRAGYREGFDRDDLAFTVELADRAGSSLDNARLYARERTAALTLQRTLLPQQVPQPTGVEVAYRYVPGSSGTEVGGDWFDVIPLPGERTALVVGDVMGHGLRAAATMGRLRTAVRVLAALDLPPDVLLRHVHELADDLAQGPDEALLATCVYAVFDPGTGTLTVAKAGHIPPVLVVPGQETEEPTRTGSPLPGGTGRILDLPSGAPLGVGGVPFEAIELKIPEGSLLALCTDGLVESRDKDLDVGLGRLITVLQEPHASIQAACEAVLDTMEQGREPDDVALLLARLGHGQAGTPTAGWTLPAEPTAVSRARRLVRATLVEWAVEELTDTAELLVSELVTNAVRYASAPIGVRLTLGETLLVEISDPLPDPPRERHAAEADEGGRGLELVRRLALRWGARAEGVGKVVWFEQALPGNEPDGP
ncbi:SpoIIE family protein phosphatase [Streptomyces kaniharaensis]|uniref:protein-serine/threonine phosphatase n=1 Tax=Streptomyces kaniharaensis TaxID=212423 RepID=A0A6N7KU52_9ACTN|nr:SpoIIE family protein phosphatase [Streptomyces kaniharaensis]MQS13837.1 SpoIIE family protein phosphatase [Streptomyces kaniharaensis]